CQQVYSDPYRF
nr:immunoglobulin light chain junction region [Macaca mulatta]